MDRRGGARAPRRSVMTGRCFRPPSNATASSSRTPGLPLMSVCGLAHGDPRGHRGRGSKRGAPAEVDFIRRRAAQGRVRTGRLGRIRLLAGGRRRLKSPALDLAEPGVLALGRITRLMAGISRRVVAQPGCQLLTATDLYA